jgi:hypothetical protein
LLLLTTVPAAFALQPPPVKANFTGTITPISVTTVNGNVYIVANDVGSFTGGISGTFDCLAHIVEHPDGTKAFHEKCTFSGTVKGGSGLGSAALAFIGTGAGPSFSGISIWTSGTGGLAGIHGLGTFVGSFTSATTAVGSSLTWFLFEPA